MMITLLSLLSLASPALAEYAIHCGEGRAQGSSKSELSLVQEDEGSKVFMGGEQLASDEYAVAAENDAWIITVFGDGTKVLDRKYEIRLKRKKVFEYKVDAKGEHSVGSPKSCVIIDTDS